jgi:hypothetical protein
MILYYQLIKYTLKATYIPHMIGLDRAGLGTGDDKGCKYLHRELGIVVFEDWLDRRRVFLLGSRDGALPYAYTDARMRMTRAHQ